jgi:hypothetical protein
MAPKKKAIRKRSPARKPVRKPPRKVARKKAAPPPPPTIAGVFQLIYTKKGFLDKLLADMNAALESAHLDLPQADRDSLKAMLGATYHVTGAEALRNILGILSVRVAPPPPPWTFMGQVTPTPV